MRNNALDTWAALGCYLVADAITIEDQGHQTNVADRWKASAAATFAPKHAVILPGQER